WSTASVSSVIAPRRFGSRPRARNSASIQPVPIPSRTRPPDRSCRVATHLAVRNAGRKGRFRTAVPSPMRWVTAAKNARVASGTSVRPVGEYVGMSGEAFGGKARRSLTHTVSKPESSTARANSRTSSRVEYGPQLRRLMLSFISRLLRDQFHASVRICPLPDNPALDYESQGEDGYALSNAAFIVQAYSTRAYG